jgi:NADPH:quinone reductase-like Zn-dependent oxidoreductase
MAPTVMKAVVTTGDGKVQLKSDIPVPKPKSTEVLVKVIAVGENPVDCTPSSQTFIDKSM